MISKRFTTYVWVVLVTIFLVIIAGSVVRTTQSGMGCPDWPTCFGSIIPPTDSQQVVFQPNHLYKKGQFILHNDSLKYAVQKFVSGNIYNATNWKQYEKHNYAKFNAIETWIEYINRLLGALLGILVLVQFIWSCWYLKANKWVAILSFALVLLTGFQAWLGKTVVDSNLALLKISLHMFGALAMVFLCQYILFIAKGKKRVLVGVETIQLTRVLLVAVFLQIILGTEVRAQIDTIASKFAYVNRSGWIDELDIWFYIHRSSSIIITLLTGYLMYKNKLSGIFKPVLMVVIAEILIGIILVYVDFPAFAQPLHLLLSSILIATVFYNWLRISHHKIH
ncbi:MAG: COX15/CtaA family protein [Chitinophagaceae bacterium]